MDDAGMTPEADELEELSSEQPAMMAPGAPMAAPAPPVHKELYLFLWGGIAVLFGCLLPVNNMAAGWQAEVFNPDLRGPIALWTVGGSLSGFAALLFIGAQLYCIRHRKLMLSPLFLMAGVAAWSWMAVVAGFDAGASFGKGDMAWYSVFYKAGYFADLWQHVGPAHLFAALGATYVWIIFLKALFGIGGGKKAAPAAEAGGRAKGRSGGSARGRRR